MPLPARIWEEGVRDMVRTCVGRMTRRWERRYVDHVVQADRGADIDFLFAALGDQVSRESH